jgi:hypothetical protein
MFDFNPKNKIERKIVCYIDILTPIKDYFNVKLSKYEIENVLKSIKDLTDTTKDTTNYTMTFTYQGKKVIIMPETILNSILEYSIYEKHWWGLKKI